MNPFSDVRIVGIGATEFSKASGRSELRLALEAVRAALADAGIAAKEVDGLTTFARDSSPEIEVARALGMPEIRFHGRAHYGGGDGCSVLRLAAMAVQMKLCNVAVVYRAFNERSGIRFGQGFAGRQGPPTAEEAQYGWSLPFGLINAAGWLGLFARRYMHEYGATSADFGRVAVASRKHAATNPAAHFYKKPITLEDHQNSRWIVEPLRLLDCCMETDGGQAFVLARADRAAHAKGKPVKLLAATQGIGYNMHLMTTYYRKDPLDFAEATLSARELWKQSGLGPSDVQAAMLYDHFTPMVLSQIESYGFCKEGEGKDFVKDGGIEIGGRLPVNTHGGQLGEAYLHGMNGIAEAVRQIRGSAVNPVKNVENVLVSSAPAVPTSALLLGRA
jgi:acetyl-CoA acetyltransferase